MIVAVAVRHNGKLYSLPKPNRHHHVIELIWKETGEEVHSRDDDQGFLDEHGTYWRRRPALYHARAVKQTIIGPIHGDRLYSENVW